MNVRRELLHILEEAHSLAPILHAATRVIAHRLDAGRSCGRARCGLALMALGIDSLSVVPTAVPELKETLAGVRLAPLQQAIAGILALPDAVSIAAALATHVEQETNRRYDDESRSII